MAMRLAWSAVVLALALAALVSCSGSAVSVPNAPAGTQPNVVAGPNALSSQAPATRARKSRRARSQAITILKNVGVDLPTMGITYSGCDYSCVYQMFFSPAIMSDINNNLQADYVRSGWIPTWVDNEPVKWQREDQFMDNACNAGLTVMVIVPGINDDAKGEQDLLDSVNDFFSRYTQREPAGCVAWGEIVNEANLPQNGYPNVSDYAAYYEQASAIVASYGVPVITSGTSGKDTTWTSNLSSLLQAAQPIPPLNGFGFHPYGVPVDEMFNATLAMQQAAGVWTWWDGVCSGTCIYVTEIGQTTATALYDTVINLFTATPTVTIYEYKAQPGENPQYGLTNNPALYSAAQSAFEYVHENQPSSRRIPESLLRPARPPVTVNQSFLGVRGPAGL
jgi:hypothetical protein